MTNRKLLLVILFFIWVLTTIVASAIGVRQGSYDSGFTMVALSTFALFTLFALFEILSNKSLNGRQKLRWVCLLLVFNVFGAVLYLVKGRKEIVNNNKINSI